MICTVARRPLDLCSPVVLVEPSKLFVEERVDDESGMKKRRKEVQLKKDDHGPAKTRTTDIKGFIIHINSVTREERGRSRLIYSEFIRINRINRSIRNRNRRRH